MVPAVPEWTPGMTESEWIHKSGMKAGFELCMQIFNPARKPKE